MRIVFDLQSCQSTSSRTRGIGRYSLAHVRAFIEKAPDHEVILVLNNGFSDTIELVQEEFFGILPRSNIQVFSALSGLFDMGPGNQWRHDASQELYQDFIRALKPDVFHVTSLFEGFSDAVTGIVNNHAGINSVTLYDLIPFQYSETYLVGEPLQNWYFRKMQALKSADILLAISESSRQEAIEIIGLPPERVVNISSAIGSHFTVSPCSVERKKELQTKFGLRDDYILYTGGIDSRKNIEGLITAYATLPIELRDRHQLAVVCNVDSASRSRLHSFAKSAGLPMGQLVLTGFVTEQELVDIYNMAKLFVFPSLHEGFGLPALEAMACGVPTLVSNTSSLPEVVGRKDVQFDPRDPRAISQSILETLTNPLRMTELREYGLQQARQFSWEKTAEVTLHAFETAVAEKKKQKPFFTGFTAPVPADLPQDGYPTPGPRPRLAFVSPLPPSESGISYYSAELLPELARYYDIDVVTPQTELSDRWIRGNFPCRTPAWFEKNASRYERVLYHFGNSSFHSHMFNLLERIPGTVVLHDFFLSGILYYQQASGAETDSYAQALLRSHGYEALQTFYREGQESTKRYPANLSVLLQAQGVIVHSEYSRTLAKEFYGPDVGSDWACIPLLRVPKPLLDNATAKQRLGMPTSSRITATFGFIAPTKLNIELIDAWVTAHENNPDAYLVFVGRNNPDIYGREVMDRIEQSPARNRIRITGFATTEDYDFWLAATDVAVQLRTSSRGETSAALYDCISAGKALIFNANGSGAELPESIACRLPDKFTQQELSQALSNLLTNTDEADLLSQAALAYRERLSPPTVARQYWQSIERFAFEHPLARQRQLLDRLRTLPDHATQSSSALVELACAATQNIDYAQLPVCYIDLTCLNNELTVELQASLARLLIELPKGWRVELVQQVAGHYQILCQLACRLLEIPESENIPLLTRTHDAWIHIESVVGETSVYSRLPHIELIQKDQLERLTPQALANWLLGLASIKAVAGN